MAQWAQQTQSGNSGTGGTGSTGGGGSGGSTGGSGSTLSLASGGSTSGSGGGSGSTLSLVSGSSSNLASSSGSSSALPDHDDEGLGSTGHLPEGVGLGSGFEAHGFAKSGGSSSGDKGAGDALASGSSASDGTRQQVSLSNSEQPGPVVADGDSERRAMTARLSVYGTALLLLMLVSSAGFLAFKRLAAGSPVGVCISLSRISSFNGIASLLSGWGGGRPGPGRRGDSAYGSMTLYGNTGVGRASTPARPAVSWNNNWDDSEGEWVDLEGGKRAAEGGGGAAAGAARREGGSAAERAPLAQEKSFFDDW
jgi:hypothetical protein